MSMFTLAISCLTTSNLPWFMDLTFQVSMQYCSLQHWNLLLSPVTSTNGWCCCFGSVPSFFLELFPYWSPVAYWAPTNLGSSSFSILTFCLFILFMGFSSHSVMSNSLWPHGLQHPRLPCPLLYLRVCSNSCSLSWWYHPTLSPLSPLFLVFPSIRVFSLMSRLSASGGQSIGA